MDHADRPPHDGDGDAQGGEAALGPVAKLGAGVEMIAVPEHLHLGPPGGRAAVRRVDAAGGWLAVRPDAGHPQQMGVAVVGQQELDRCVGHHGREGPLDHVDDLGLTFRHVQGIGQATLEALALPLHLAGDALAVGDLNGLAQLMGECAHLVVGLLLLAIADDDQHEDQRKQDGDEDGRRHQVPHGTRSVGTSDGHRRHGQEPEDDQSGQRADEPQALGLRHLAMPFLFSDHAYVPFTRRCRSAQGQPAPRIPPDEPAVVNVGSNRRIFRGCGAAFLASSCSPLATEPQLEGLTKA